MVHESTGRRDLDGQVGQPEDVQSGEAKGAGAQPLRTMLPPPLPLQRAVEQETPLGGDAAEERKEAPPKAPMPPPIAPTKASEPVESPAKSDEAAATAARRSAQRRPAGPPRAAIAANDDVPSIGGLIYALQQTPSQRPMTIAAIASGVWAFLGLLLGWAMLAPELQRAPTFLEMLSRPTAITLAATIVIPIALFWFLALLVWRAQELRLMSSAMTEVAIRLAEPDRMAEQQIASVGQAVRRQVSFMNEAVSRALGRAGELEALVHNEVAALERAYSENEHRIRGLLHELSGERHALLNTSERMNLALKEMGAQIPTLLDRLSQQQLNLTSFIEGAGRNLSELESTLSTSAERVAGLLGHQTERIEGVLDKATTALSEGMSTRLQELRTTVEQQMQALDTTMAGRAEALQTVFEGYAGTLNASLDERQQAIEGQMRALDTTLANRTEGLQTVFEEYARALDMTLANRQEAIEQQLTDRVKAIDGDLTVRLDTLDGKLGDRIKAIDMAFSERLRLFDETVMRSAHAIDVSIAEKSKLLATVLDSHSADISGALTHQAQRMDQQLMTGVQAVREVSETVTRQSMQAIEGLAGQAEMLRNISDGLLNQISNVAGRFESQGVTIMKAAEALESANMRIDRTLELRQTELSKTLNQLADKTGDIDRTMRGYATSLEGTLADAETRARQVGEHLTRGAEERSRVALTELERLRSSADLEADRALEDLKSKISVVSQEVSEQIGSLTSRFSSSSDEMRLRARAALQELQGEHVRLQEQMLNLPEATRASAEAMRLSLQEQLSALQQLSSLTGREARRDVVPPAQLPPPPSPAAQSPAPPPRAPVSSTPPTSVPPAAQPAYEQPARSRAAGPGATMPRTEPTGGNGWSLGDLLARASEDDGRSGADAAGINVQGIARALDATTASAIWSRFRTGQRGIMVRSIYSVEGRAIFDEVQRRYRNEAPFRSTVDRFLFDFEQVLREADQKDPSGRAVQGYIVTDGGRVYLFLAHASGRLA